MYELDDLIYYGKHIVGSTYSLCGINYGKHIYLSGYRHKYYSEIECIKCKEIYKFIRDNGFRDCHEFMSDFKYRYYNSDALNNKQIYEDFKEGKIDLNTGLSAYSEDMKKIIKKAFLDNNDIEFLKWSNEVKNIDIQDEKRYYWKYVSVNFELLYGDKIYKQTEMIYTGVNYSGN